MLTDELPEEAEATEEPQNSEILDDNTDDQMVDLSAYEDIISLLNITTKGRHISLLNPEERVQVEHYMNYVSTFRVPEGQVKCLSTNPSCLKLTTTYPTNKVLESKNYEDFVYVRSLMGYMCGKYFVKEIPSRAIILPSQRLGYYTHLLQEREDDGLDSNETSDESYIKTLSVLKEAVHNSIEEDPNFVQALSPFITRAKDARRLNDADLDIKPPVQDESDPNNEESNVAEFSDKAERAPVKDVSVLAKEKNDYKRALDEYEQQRASAQSGLKKILSKKAEYELILKRPRPKSKEELDAEANAATRRMIQIDFMVEKPIEDELPHPESNKYLGEYFKLKPVLKVCAKCGDSNHSDHKCSFESVLDGSKKFKSDPSKYEGCDWFTPDADSLAAKGVNNLLKCMYLYCRDRESHVVATCPAMHGRCGTCHTRGHDNEVIEALDELDGSTVKITVNCPIVQTRLMQIEGNTGKVFGATWRNLQEVFEQFANQGEFTKYRFSQPVAGWYPVRSEKDGRILKAIGYKWLSRLSAEKSVGLLSGFSLNCQALQGPPFLTFTDSEWELITRRRDAKRSADKIDKLESKKMKTSRQSSPSVQSAAKVPRQTIAPNATFPIPPVDYSRPPPVTYATALSTPSTPQPKNRPQAARGSKNLSPRTRYRSNRPSHNTPASQQTPTPSGSSHRSPSTGYAFHQQRLKATAKNAKAFYLDFTEADTYFPPKSSGKANTAKPYRSAFPPHEYANWNKKHDNAAKSSSSVSTKNPEPPKKKPSANDFTFEDLK